MTSDTEWLRARISTFARDRETKARLEAIAERLSPVSEEAVARAFDPVGWRVIDSFRRESDFYHDKIGQVGYSDAEQRSERARLKARSLEQEQIERARAAIAAMPSISCSMSAEVVKALEAGLEYAIDAANECKDKGRMFEQIMNDVHRIEAALAQAPRPMAEGEKL